MKDPVVEYLEKHHGFKENPQGCEYIRPDPKKGLIYVYNPKIGDFMEYPLPEREGILSVEYYREKGVVRERILSGPDWHPSLGLFVRDACFAAHGSGAFLKKPDSCRKCVLSEQRVPDLIRNL